MASPDYRSLLREELARRQGNNRAYSRSSFARDMGISPSYLSLLLQDQRSLNEPRAHRIATRLSWDESKSRQFLLMVRLEQAKSKAQRDALMRELRESGADPDECEDISIAQFKIVSRWYHTALLELTRVEDFQPDPRWIAQRLGITELEADLALERLIRIGLLDRSEKIVHRSDKAMKVKSQPSDALRSFHRTMLSKADKVIDGDFGSRDISGCTMAIDSRKYAQAKKLIEAFRLHLSQALKSDRPDSIFHLGVQFFRVDKETDQTH